MEGLMVKNLMILLPGFQVLLEIGIWLEASSMVLLGLPQLQLSIPEQLFSHFTQGKNLLGSRPSIQVMQLSLNGKALLVSKQTETSLPLLLA